MALTRASGLDAWVDLAAGWVLAGAGLAAWLRAPRSRIGPLLVARRAAWFLGTLVGASTPSGARTWAARRGSSSRATPGSWSRRW